MDQKTYEYMQERVIKYQSLTAKREKLDNMRLAYEANKNIYTGARVEGNQQSLIDLLTQDQKHELSQLIACFIWDVEIGIDKEMGEI